MIDKRLDPINIPNGKDTCRNVVLENNLFLENNTNILFLRIKECTSFWFNSLEDNICKKTSIPIVIKNKKINNKVELEINAGILDATREKEA